MEENVELFGSTFSKVEEGGKIWDCLAPPFERWKLLKRFDTLPKLRRLIQSKRPTLLSQVHKRNNKL